ncbi:MAG: hypothetical protein ABSH05_23015 [Bryobacteraceae bacterium]|jgi:hypothetical protein
MFRELIAIAVAPALFVPLAAAADTKTARKPFRAQASSTILYGVANGEETVEIQNVAYEVAGDHIPGRPPEERLVLRTTTHTKEVLGDIGMQAAVTLEAWPFGLGLEQKPLYSITLDGVEVRVTSNALLVFERGTEEVSWWSIHKLGNGGHLFDTYVPLLEFSLSREILTPRYIGLEVPPDDTPDARLKEPHVVGVLIYASAERVIREALITCDDPQRARLLRSYADVERTVSLLEGPKHTIRISFTPSYPAEPTVVEALVPLAADDLDLARARLAPGMHLRAWQR